MVILTDVISYADRVQNLAYVICNQLNGGWPVSLEVICWGTQCIVTIPGHRTIAFLSAEEIIPKHLRKTIYPNMPNIPDTCPMPDHYLTDRLLHDISTSMNTKDCHVQRGYLISSANPSMRDAGDNKKTFYFEFNFH